MRSYLVCIINNSHKLINSVYGSNKYDQIGFVCDETLYLYWTLPTKTLHYVGPLTNLQVVGMKLYRSKLKEKCSLAKFRAYFLHDLNTSLQDVKDVVKGLFYALTGQQIDREVAIDNLSKIFYPPELAFTDDILREPKCKDLIIKLCSNSLLDISNAEKMIISVKRDLEKNLITQQTLKMLQMPLDGKKDAIVVIERDKSVSEAMRILKRRIENALSTESVNLIECVDLVNNVLSIYDEPLIDKRIQDMTLKVYSYDDKLSINGKTISINLIDEKVLDETLTKDELLQMLTFLNEELPNSNSETFKSMITNVIYKKLST